MFPTSNGAGQREENLGFNLNGRIYTGIALAFLLVFVCGGWAVASHLTGAIIASGSVKVDRNLKAIQHRDGGIVSSIDVREGDFVQAGQILLRLDDVQTRAELSIIRSQLVELIARRARLLAEREGAADITFPEGFADRAPEAFEIAASEARLFHGNRTARESQKEQLTLRVAQIEKETIGLEAQRIAKVDEIRLVEAENDKLKALFSKGLIPSVRIYDADRETARLLGSRGEIEASIARAHASISEIRVQIIALEQNSRTDAQRELALAEAKISELDNRRIAVEDRLSRTDIRSPLSGYVNELSVHTIGGVITPAERLITIVPENATLRIEAKLQPSDIDQVETGRPARLRFSAFNQNTTPEIFGSVAHVSPATTRDAVTGEFYYVADIEIAADEMEKLGRKRLVPGMPVEVYIATTERMALSYLVKPFMDQVARAFREE